MNRNYERGLESFQRQTGGLVESGSVPPWATLAGFVLVAVFGFSMIIQSGGSEDAVNNTPSQVVVSDTVSARPSTPTASTAVDTTVPSTPEAEDRSVFTAEGSEVLVPGLAIQALETFIEGEVEGATVSFDATTVAVTDAGFVFDTGFLSGDGRFFTAVIRVVEDGGSWQASL